jgi:hypothetical protein
MRRRLIPLAALVLLPMFLSPTGELAAHATPRLEGVPSFGHVFVIIGENTELSQLNKNSAPYQTGFIKQHAAWLTNFWATSHYSTSNYIGMTSGQFLPCDQADHPPATCNQDVTNIFGQLTAAGISWTGWNESMPSPCYLVNSGSSKTFNSYRVKHNPAVYYADTEGAGGVWSTADGLHGTSQTCLDNVISTGGTGPNDTSALDAALLTGNVSRFNYIVPNQCEDSHDNCAPTNNRVLQYDQFLRREVPKILNSPAFTSDPNAVLIVTYDEGNGAGPHNADQKPPGFGGGNTAFAVMGPLAHVATYTGLHNQYGMLRTLEDGFGILTHPAGAGDPTPPIGEIWN